MYFIFTTHVCQFLSLERVKAKHEFLIILNESVQNSNVLFFVDKLNTNHYEPAYEGTYGIENIWMSNQTTKKK